MSENQKVFYPEFDSSGIGNALKNAHKTINSAVEFDKYNRPSNGTRHSQAHTAMGQRLFILDFWEADLCLGYFNTADLIEAARAQQSWIEHQLTPGEISEKFPELRMEKIKVVIWQQRWNKKMGILKQKDEPFFITNKFIVPSLNSSALPDHGIDQILLSMSPRERARLATTCKRFGYFIHNRELDFKDQYAKSFPVAVPLLERTAPEYYNRYPEEKFGPEVDEFKNVSWEEKFDIQSTVGRAFELAMQEFPDWRKQIKIYKPIIYYSGDESMEDVQAEYCRKWWPAYFEAKQALSYAYLRGKDGNIPNMIRSFEYILWKFAAIIVSWFENRCTKQCEPNHFSASIKLFFSSLPNKYTQILDGIHKGVPLLAQRETKLNRMVCEDFTDLYKYISWGDSSDKSTTTNDTKKRKSSK